MIQLSVPQIGIAGTGSFVPENVITNAQLAGMINIPDKGADWAEAKLGISERRFMTALDPETGLPVAEADELDMAEKAARRALEDAGLEAQAVDALYFVSCTQSGDDRHHFSTSAHELHMRLGLKPSTLVREMDAGCGGMVHAIIEGQWILLGSGRESMLIVAVNGPSRYYNQWKAYVESGTFLSMYVFGDGAGAVVLRRSSQIASGSRIVAQYLGVDPAQTLMRYHVPEGSRGVPVYDIDGRAVAATFGSYVQQALKGLGAEVPDFDLTKVDRFYFHQVNGKVLQKAVRSMGLPEEKVAMHVNRYANLAAAATPVLLDEDRRAGIVRDGNTCVFCTVGAGVQYGALLVKL